VPVLLLLAALPPGAVSPMSLVQDLQRVAHKSAHCDQLSIYIPKLML
jgi:hypothetical protein